MRKILSVIGTRPEAIKMAPVIRGLNGADGVENLVCVTGTGPEAIKRPRVIRGLKGAEGVETLVCVPGHPRPMLDQVRQLFRIVRDHALAIMNPAQPLADIPTAVLTGLTRLFEETK